MREWLPCGCTTWPILSTPIQTPSPAEASPNGDSNLYTLAPCTLPHEAANPALLAKLFSRSVYQPSTGCRVWQGGTSSQGRYGSLWHNGTVRYAHRVAYEAAFGELPCGSLTHESESTEVHHVCGNRLCVEPSHLELITRRHHSQIHVLQREADRQLAMYAAVAA